MFATRELTAPVIYAGRYGRWTEIPDRLVRLLSNGNANYGLKGAEVTRR